MFKRFRCVCILQTDTQTEAIAAYIAWSNNMDLRNSTVTHLVLISYCLVGKLALVTWHMPIKNLDMKHASGCSSTI